MVGDSVTTVINIVNYISLNAYYRQPPKSNMIFLDLCSWCRGIFFVPLPVQESHCPNKHRLHFIYLMDNNREYTVQIRSFLLFFLQIHRIHVSDR